MRWLARDIVLLELRHPDDHDLAPVEAGAHIELSLPGGLRRQYSLLNAPGERHRYQVAVHRTPSGRGGSRYVHDTLRVGQLVDVSGPRNHFALDEGAAHTVMFGGGIGVTPLLSMAHRLRAMGASWSLHYAVRDRVQCAFAETIQRWGADAAGHAHIHIDEEAQGLLDIATIVTESPAGTHFYCCGPAPMLAAFEQATSAVPASRVHVEVFQAREPSAKAAAGEDFVIELSRSGRVLSVPAGRSMLDVLLDAGVDAPFSCGEGFCGSCRIPVLQGIPDHRDSVLSAAERASNSCVLACCSRSLTERLVIDL